MERIGPDRPVDKFSGIAIVGEAASDVEMVKKRPLVGPSGNLLNRCLRSKEVRLPRTSLHLTNLFDWQLPDNELKNIAVGKVDQRKDDTPEPDVDPEVREVAWQKPAAQGCYLPKKHWWNLQRLKDELEELQPSLVVPLGSTALWALTGQNKIGKARGSALWSTLLPGVKCLPSYHPAYILRNYRNRIILIQDLRKAVREAEDPHTIETTERELWLEPTTEDLRQFWSRYIKPLRNSKTPVGCDIETSRGQIECVGFAPSKYRGIVVPFIDYDRLDGNKPFNYWNTVQKEWWAWEWCRKILEDPALKILGQNFVYDVRWLLDKGPQVATINYSEDTRLQHHSLYPELPKDLGFLTSVYEKERAFKHLGKESKQDG